MMEYLISHIVFIAVVALIVGMMLLGHKRGFFRTAQHLIALAVSVVLFRFLYPHLLVWLENSSMINAVTEKLREALSSSWQDPDAELLTGFFGIDALSVTAGETLKQLVIRLLGFIVLYFVVLLLVRCMQGILDTASELPVISGLNQIAGALLGTAMAVVYVWIFMMLVSVFSYQEWAGFVISQIHASRFLEFLYRNNLLLHFLKGMLQTIL